MKKGALFTATGLLLIAAALCITVYNIWDNRRAGSAADNIMEQIEIQPAVVPASTPAPLTEENIETPVWEDEPELPDYILNPEMDMPEQQIDVYEYIGVLKIPAIDRELPVISSWNYPALKVSPCRYSGSAYLDNLIILAHNYNRHFGNLKALCIGDSISFTDIDGNEFMYEVAEIETLQPTDFDGMSGSGYALTLFTCTLGGRSRVTVRCNRCS